MENSKEKTKGQLLQEELTWKFPSIAQAAPDRIEAAQAFCEPYKAFLSEAKTERECTKKAEALLKEAGYTVFDPSKKYAAGDKVYMNNRGKAIIATTFGTHAVSEGVRINVAHIDAPRLDLKPTPLYEKNDIAYFKTHYYGGIRKYQWATIPLSLHGVLYKKNGEAVEVNIGENPSDPVFYISDLLPHLAAKQNSRSLGEGLKGEELNIVLGTLPYPEKDIKEPVKLMVLSILNEKYGITEADFYRAELELVAAGPARDIGFDRSLIGAAGHDDRVCAYPALMAEIAADTPTYTTVTILTDKEEIGSVGNTGLHSDYVKHYLEYIAENAGVSFKEMVKNSLCLSSDVNAAFDPTFPDVYEAANASYLGKGCVLTKYTGSRGKGGSSDASAETMAKVIGIMEDAGVYWQAGELGKVDEGGGGTVAQFIAGLNIDVVDLGVPVMSMHAPIEVVSKLDVYETYLAFAAFYK
jgi:aspartyl aminopeptidase